VLSTRVSIRLAFVAFLLTSCGMPTNEKSVKNFVLSCMNCDSSLHDGFSRIVHQYNSEAGFEALQYTTNSEDANSPVYLTQGLNMREGKVGWGQWLSETEERRSYLPQPKALRTVSYSMRVELDKDFMQTRINSIRESDKTDVRKLFYHETGHGLQMAHHPDPNNVMYFDISGDKDFNLYFTDVRAFFGK